MKLRISAAIALSAALLSGTALLWTSQRVQMEEEQRRELTEAVASEQETIRVLAAEWAYLNRPDRLEALAREYLAMAPPEPLQIVPSAASLPERLIPAIPRRKPALDIQPAVFGAPVKPPVVKEAVKDEPRLTKEDNKSFYSLLEELEGGRR